MPDLVVRAITGSDRLWVERFIIEQWGAPVVVHGDAYYPHTLPGFIVESDGERVGLLTYTIVDHACEIVTLDALVQGRGIGTALVNAIRVTAQAAGCERLWLVTTNDNLDALRFYQRRGFELVAVHRGAINESRRLKPSIPSVGAYGIPIRDEIEMELPLTSS